LPLVIVGSSTATVVALFLDHNCKSNFIIHTDPRDKSWALVRLRSYFKTHVYVPLLLIICQESGEQTLQQCSIY
jgi:hypothetical protein